MFRYLNFDKEDSNTLKGFGGLLIIFGGFFITFSLISYLAFENGISTLKFLFIFIVSIPLIFCGILFWKKAEFIANKSLTDQKWKIAIYSAPVVAILLIIVFLEELYQCDRCTAITLIVLICYILILLIITLIYLYSQKKQGKLNLNQLSLFGSRASFSSKSLNLNKPDENVIKLDEDIVLSGEPDSEKKRINGSNVDDQLASNQKNEEEIEDQYIIDIQRTLNLSGKQEE